ncbi:MAG: hypothetical protein AAFX94_02740 [Myxococcota bacterium]
MRLTFLLVLVALPWPGHGAKPPPEVVDTLSKTAAAALAADCLANGWAGEDVRLKVGTFEATKGWKRTANKVRGAFAKEVKETLTVTRSRPSHVVTGEMTVVQEAVEGGETWTFSFTLQVMPADSEEKLWIGEHVERVLIQQ